MADAIEVRVPDIGEFSDVPVIEVLVKPGDRVKKDDSLITLESEKASMEVPSSAEGTVQDVKVKVGDKISKGAVIATLSDGKAAASAAADGETSAKSEVAQTQTAEPKPKAAAPDAERVVELKVPDIGDYDNVPVIELYVKAGDTVGKDTSIATLESEKASIEVPAGTAGTIEDVRIKVGDKVSKGAVLATIRSSEAAPFETPATRERPVVALQDDKTIGGPAPAPPPARSEPAAKTPEPAPQASADGRPSHASPSIRRLARELGVDLTRVAPSGPNRRVTRSDVNSFVKTALQGGAGGFGISGLPPWPKVDFAQYGPIERQPLSRIRKLAGPNLHRNWLSIPHITNQDEADVTDLEAFRQEINTEQKKSGIKVTLLAFLVKTCVAVLQDFPEFNSSLDGDQLVIKKYYNIGFAADTPNGLMVPVIKNADTKGLLDVARESAELAAKARDGKLSLTEMQGGTFTISSIGGIGGTAFTQIINAPEVAILGVTRAATKPVWDGKEFVPRLMLPIDVSYDHRVIDGAAAARFLVCLAGLLGDVRRVLL